jgi:hypothetical protein
MTRRRRPLGFEAMESRYLLSAGRPHLATRNIPQSLPQHRPSRRAPLQIGGVVTATWVKSVPMGPEMSAAPPAYSISSGTTDLGSLGPVKASGMILGSSPSGGVYLVGVGAMTGWSDGHLKLQGRRGSITLRLLGPDFDPSPQPGSSTATDMTYTVQRSDGAFAGFRSTGPVHVVLKQDANPDPNGMTTGVITFFIGTAKPPD